MPKQFILDLVADMTLEEKAMQMTQLAPEFFYHKEPANLTGPFRQWRFEEDQLACMGSTLGPSGASYLRRLQEDYLAVSRQKIPLLFMSDVIHGYRTVYPIPLAQGCSFDDALVEEAAAATAKEAAAAGLHVTFSPMVDLVRDPRWGRVMESPGEDPYLNGRMAAAMVRGYQGTDLKEKGRIAACIKHFAAYGQPEAGREYNTVDMSRGVLRDFYLPPYQEAVKAGAAMVMTSFNLVERVPATCNKLLLRRILRSEWGFKGVVISDFAAVDETMNHSVAADPEEAARKCVQAGLDIEMMSGVYASALKKLVEEGRLAESEVDECVIRILELKDRLGLFENPYKDADEKDEKTLLLCKEHRALSRKLAREGMVLLKNNGILPLDGSQKIGLAGPFADTGCILGGWHCEGKVEEAVTLRQGMEESLGRKLPVGMSAPFLYTERHDVPDDVCGALDALSDSQVCVVAIGEPQWETGEASSRTNLRLTPHQEKLVHALKAAGKQVVAVLFTGRPMEIAPILEDCDAVLQVWFPGTEGGRAVSDILFGQYNPSGKLAMTFPRNVGQIPVYYNHYQTGRPLVREDDYFTSRYLDCPNSPLFAFGYGLSYTEFTCSGLAASPDGTQASVTVKNVGARAGETVVQLYVRDVSASVARPVKELKAYRRIALEAGEKAAVSFEVTDDMLGFYNEEEEWVHEPGWFDLFVGLDSERVEQVRIYRK